jgi:hypothetical protein
MPRARSAAGRFYLLAADWARAIDALSSGLKLDPNPYRRSTCWRALTWKKANTPMRARYSWAFRLRMHNTRRRSGC